MAIVKKTEVLQVRCVPEDLAAFQAACELVGIKPTERIRRFMVEEAATIQRKVANAAAWRADKASREAAAAAVVSGGASVPVPAQKSPVGPVRQPQSLSERMKAERAAKAAKKARREDRY